MMMLTVNCYRPVTPDGVWHLTRRSASNAPKDGERVICLCDRLYIHDSRARKPDVTTTCWKCDAAFRREMGWNARHGRPALPDAG
jgi:hypothetical protein